MKCFIDDSLSLLGEDFSNMPPTFFISCGVLTSYSEILKCSEQFFRDHLSETIIMLNFFLGVWHSVNSSSVSVTDLTLSSLSMQLISVSDKNLVFY